jgi:hypothetical protein
MELTPFAVDRHIEEALRLFQVPISIFYFHYSDNVRYHFLKCKRSFHS